MGEGKISIPESRVKPLRNYIRLRSKKGLRTFLGMVSFYRQYINMLAEHMAALSPATAKSEPSVVVWMEERSKAFHAICKLVCDSCALEIPLPQDEFSLVTDASGFGLGAVLQVKRKEGWTAAAFYSRQTRGPERRYSASKLEALAVVDSVKHFSPCLYGQKFVVFSDHKPLCFLLTSDHLNGRLKRFSTKLQPWMIEFRYLPGMDNTMADTLSRQDWQTREEERETDLPTEPHHEEVKTGATVVPKFGAGVWGTSPTSRGRNITVVIMS